MFPYFRFPCAIEDCNNLGTDIAFVTPSKQIARAVDALFELERNLCLTRTVMFSCV